MRMLVKAGAAFLVCVCCAPRPTTLAAPVTNPRSFDGYGNNLLNPDWGAAGQAFVRSAASNSDSGARYPGDGAGTVFAGGPGDTSDLPNPRDISNKIFHSQGQPIPSHRWCPGIGRDRSNPGRRHEDLAIVCESWLGDFPAIVR